MLTQQGLDIAAEAEGLVALSEWARRKPLFHEQILWFFVPGFPLPYAPPLLLDTQGICPVKMLSEDERKGGQRIPVILALSDAAPALYQGVSL